MGGIGGQDLGTFGVWTFDFEDQPAAQMVESVQELEEQGWRAFWIPELLGREAFSHAGLLLSCTERITVINGIAQIWAREARWMVGGSRLLADAYPGRYVLGLARDRAAGAHSYKVNVAHTAQAREILGPDAFLGVEHAVLFESDPDEARAIARRHLDTYLNGKFNIAKFRRLGYTEDDISNGGSDRFVDDFVFWGDLDTIVEKLRAHVEAGADHVGVQVIGIEPGRSAMPYWRMLGEALLPQGVGV